MNHNRPDRYDQASSKADSNGGNVRYWLPSAYLSFEVLAAIVFGGALFWLVYNAAPIGPVIDALSNLKVWILVLLLSGLGTAFSLVPYSVGQRGTKAVFDHYPRLEGRPWARLQARFQQWGPPTLIFSGIPLLGAALIVAAGAFGVGRLTFLCWSFLGKVLRNWLFAFTILYGFELLS